jgi:hypothetical protein
MGQARPFNTNLQPDFREAGISLRLRIGRLCFLSIIPELTKSGADDLENLQTYSGQLFTELVGR